MNSWKTPPKTARKGRSTSEMEVKEGIFLWFETSQQRSHSIKERLSTAIAGIRTALNILVKSLRLGPREELAIMKFTSSSSGMQVIGALLQISLLNQAQPGSTLEMLFRFVFLQFRGQRKPSRGRIKSARALEIANQVTLM